MLSLETEIVNTINSIVESRAQLKRSWNDVEGTLQRLYEHMYFHISENGVDIGLDAKQRIARIIPVYNDDEEITALWMAQNLNRAKIIDYTSPINEYICVPMDDVLTIVNMYAIKFILKKLNKSRKFRRARVHMNPKLQ